MTAAREWADRALADVMDRVAVTASEVGERFPLFADPDSGRWTTTRRGTWTGGFWAGLLWVRAHHTGREADRAVASACTGRLAEWVDADTATRGLILWYGTALAYGDGEAAEAAALRDKAARACLSAVEPELGLVPWGSAFGGERLLARVDGAPGMVPLLTEAGPDGATAAAAHLHRHLELCLGDGALVPSWRFDTDTGWHACDDPPSGWSRGRAWLLLAVADALLRPGVVAWNTTRLESAAARLACVQEEPSGRLVPLADATRPDGPLDTSAAAITSVALMKLARIPGPRAAEYSRRADAILEFLVTAHLTGPGEKRPAGMLLDGCYDAARGTAPCHELVWGDFFLALALAAHTGLVDVRCV
ncbi:sugar ABC transporter permease [Streptomyces sp. NPDC059881]|uniref:sugar ABC transporter permease n=1 Tax=Streptomyces sp. NPDC059881 TaxID=3346986 RepID=UPI003654DA8C